MKLDELIRNANTRLSELGLARPDGRVAEWLVPRNVSFLRQAGLISRPEGIGSGASWGDIHLQQLITVRVMQSTGLAISEIRDKIQGLDLEHLHELVDKVLASRRVAESAVAEISPCSSWLLTPEYMLVSTGRAKLSQDKLQQIRSILSPKHL